MKCGTCTHDNPPDSLFCEGCGGKLETTCPACGASVNPGARFCRKCGAQTGQPAASPPPPVAAASERRIYTPKHLADRILQSRSALEGERKQVSVLFADVKGSMELAEQLDPEAWHKILERFFEILTDGVHRFEGTVNQYTGDGVMALFGAPIAHEDHAQRACYAALHLRDALKAYGDELRVTHGLNFGFRIGMNSGEVVVGKIGDDLRMDYTAQGHTVGLAQRMEALADSRSIVLSANTARLVGGYFAMRDLGQMRIKGVAEAQHVFELEGLGTHRTRLDTSRARGLSRFVGRGDEMATLETALQRSLEGTGRVAAVVGEPGVGKSRLCAEFVERCRMEQLRVFEAHCPAHGKTIPYLPLLELLRNLFGVTDQDGAREARQKIAGELALLDDAFADDRTMVLDFLGVADPKTPLLQLEPAVRQQRLFAFLRRLIQRRTEAEPIVILIDDLHWIDPGSDLFVAQIVEAVSSTRTLLLVNFRPEYEAAWTRKSWVLQLPMAPLSAEALAELVRDWVGSRPSVSTLPALIGTRSGGNPFFAEEIVLSLLDTGKLVGSRGSYELTAAIESLDVPPTVRALLAARIDRLGEREKQVLYTAAVIGKEFARPLLEVVIDLSADELDAALSALRNAEMINERSLYPVAEYSFKHPLTHEVALHAQLGNARRERHAAVATAIEAASPAQLDERAGLLAHHWQEAGDPLRAAGWHVRAARWVRANDIIASRRHWTQARALLVPLPDSDERTRLLLEVYPELINLLDRLGAEASQSDAIHTEGIAFARQAGSRVTEALLEAAYGYLVTARGDWPRVIECGLRAVTLAEQEGDVAVEVFGRFVAGRGYGWSGRPAEMAVMLDPVASKFEGDQGWDIEVLGWPVYAEALSMRANLHSFCGQPLVARQFTERLSARLRRTGHAQDLTSAACDRIYTWMILGDAELARRDATEALVLGERFGSPRNTVYALLACGMASSLAARWNDGEGFLARAQQLIDVQGAGREWQTIVQIFRALCMACLGEHPRSIALARQAASAAMTPVDKTHLFQIARALRVAGGAGYAAEIDAVLGRSIAEILRSQFVGWLPMALLERAALARLRGDSAGMAGDLIEARRLFAKMGVTGWNDYARSIER